MILGIRHKVSLAESILGVPYSQLQMKVSGPFYVIQHLSRRGRRTSVRTRLATAGFLEANFEVP